MSPTLPAPAVEALRAFEIVGELADIVGRMRPDDVAHFWVRSLISPLLDAAGVVSVHHGPEGRVWLFGADTSEIVEPVPGLDEGAQMRVRACTDALVRLLRCHERAGEVVVRCLADRLGVQADQDDLIERIQGVDPYDDEQVYEVQVAVADALVALERALPAVHEHLILASLARLVNEAGLRKGRLRTSEGGGLVLEFSVRSDLELRWGTAPGSPTG